MNLGLDGHVAIVFGGGRGIGRSIASAFAAESATTVVVDREPINDWEGQSFVASVTDLDAMNRVAEAVGRVDHVVFAVGIGSGKYGFPFWNVSPADWARVFEVNVIGAVNVAHAFGPKLVMTKSGTMLFLSSVAGQIGSQTDPPYSASKAALINFAQCAARDFAPHGVRVNTICPGMVQTELNKSVWAAWDAQQPADAKRSYEDWAGEKVRRVVPLGRWQSPEDIASMAVFLASERASNVTGQTINVDGGFVMHW